MISNMPFSVEALEKVQLFQLSDLGTLMIGLPQVHPLNSLRYVRLESQKVEVDSWHKTAFPVYDV